MVSKPNDPIKCENHTYRHSENIQGSTVLQELWVYTWQSCKWRQPSEQLSRQRNWCHPAIVVSGPSRPAEGHVRKWVAHSHPRAVYLQHFDSLMVR